MTNEQPSTGRATIRLVVTVTTRGEGHAAATVRVV